MSRLSSIKGPMSAIIRSIVSPAAMALCGSTKLSLRPYIFGKTQGSRLTLLNYGKPSGREPHFQLANRTGSSVQVPALSDGLSDNPENDKYRVGPVSLIKLA